MTRFITLMHDKPLVFAHLIAAVAALLLGIAILTRRKGTFSHRTLGWTWVTLMAAAAASSVFIRDYKIPNIAGYTPIHLMVPAVFFGLGLAFWMLARRNVRGHRIAMQITYVSACLVAGGFTLLPNRYLGQLVWGQWLGLV